MSRTDSQRGNTAMHLVKRTISIAVLALTAAVLGPAGAASAATSYLVECHYDGGVGDWHSEYYDADRAARAARICAKGGGIGTITAHP